MLIWRGEEKRGRNKPTWYALEKYDEGDIEPEDFNAQIMIYAPF